MGEGKGKIVLDQLADLLGERAGGPMKFRLVIQPVVAAVLATRTGLKDARAGNPPFLWGAITHAGKRMAILKHGWNDVGKVFMIAIVLDGVYQYLVFKSIRPAEALIAATALAIVPYVFIRGPVARIAGRARK